MRITNLKNCLHLYLLGIAVLLPAFLSGVNFKGIYPYCVNGRYDDTWLKDYSNSIGLYGYYNYQSKHVFEGDFSLSRIHYRGYELPGETVPIQVLESSIDQIDYTLIYSSYPLQNLGIRLGMHGIKSDDLLTDKGLIKFAGIFRYRPKEYSAGITYYASNYDNFDNGLDVTQVEGTFGFYFGNPYTYGGLYAQTTGTFIKLSRDVGWGDKKFTSIRQDVQYNYDNFIVNLYFWTGEQVFAVQNQGFTVFNLNEKHISSIGMEFSYKFSTKWSAKLDYQLGRFNEVGVSEQASSEFLTLLIAYDF